MMGRLVAKRLKFLRCAWFVKRCCKIIGILKNIVIIKFGKFSQKHVCFLNYTQNRSRVLYFIYGPLLNSYLVHLVLHCFTLPANAARLFICVWPFRDFIHYRVNPLSTNPTKWSNTFKQFVGFYRRIVWLCLTILCGWWLKLAFAIKL